MTSRTMEDTSEPVSTILRGQRKGTLEHHALLGLDADEVPREQIPAVLSHLAALQSALAARLMVPEEKGNNGGLQDAQPCLDVPAVARLLNVPRSRVYELIRRGDLPAI